LAARALSPAPLPFRQSSQVMARGIKASGDVIDRAPSLLIPVGQTHRTSSAAVIFAVTAPAGPAGKPGNSELSPSPSPRIFAPLPASRWRHAWRRHCSARLDHPLVSPCAAQTASHPGRPHPRGRPRRSKLPQTTSRRHPVAFQMIAKKKKLLLPMKVRVVMGHGLSGLFTAQ